MSVSSEIVPAKKSQPVGQERRTRSQLAVERKSKALKPVVDLERLRKEATWHQKVHRALGPASFMLSSLPMALGAMMLVHGSWLIGGVSAIAGAGVFFIDRWGSMNSYGDERWTKEQSEVHLRAWIREQWGIEPNEAAFKNDDLRYFVNADAVGEFTFAALNGATYKVSRHAVGGSVDLTDVRNREVARASGVEKIMAAAKVPTENFDARGKQAAQQILTLMTQLRGAKGLSPENQHVIERSGLMLGEASELAERVGSLSGGMRDKVLEQLTETLEVALTDLERVRQEQLQASISQVEVLATFAKSIAPARSSRIKLPEAHQ